MPSNYAKMSFLGKNLKGSFNASLNGHPFRLNPMSISLDYTVKTSQTPTINGMVVQIFGVEMGDLVVTGSFGKGGWQEQVKFLDRMLALGNAQASPLGVHNASPPFRFLYPQRNYDFLVYLKEYSSASGLAVDYQNENFAPDWKLTFFIDNDNTNGKLSKVASNAYIDRLNAGFGYAPNKYMGQISASDVETFLTAQGFSNNIQGYINAAFADPSFSINPSATANSSGFTPVTSEGGNEQTIWTFLIGKGLQPFMAAGIMGNLQQESSFNPNLTGASGLGIAQWIGDRRTAVDAYAASVKLPDTSLSVQLNYLWKELTSNYSAALSAVQSSTTASAAAAAFEANYEKASGGGDLPQRQTNAEAILTQFGGG